MLRRRGTRDRRDEIEVRQCAAGTHCAFAQRTQKHFGGFGNERVAKPAISHLTGESQVSWAHCRHIDRHVLRPHQRSQRSTITVRQRKRIDFALMLEPVSAADDPDDLDSFFCRLYRPAKSNTMPALHHPGPRCTNTQ